MTIVAELKALEGSAATVYGRSASGSIETTHEVTPVTHGERYSIASWYR